MNLIAQHTVSGIVSDKKDNSLLLEGVSVSLPEFFRSDITKEGGTYLITNVGIGVVAIQFSKDGYQSLLQFINTKDSAVVLHIELEKTASGCQQNTITKENLSLPESHSYSNLVYSSKALRRIDRINNFAALSYTPGFDIIAGSTNIFDPSIRGISSSQIAIYSNGATQLQSNWNSPFLSTITSSGIENLELVKGPTALFYSNNSIGGVIIYHDEKPSIAGTSSGDINLGFFSSTFGGNLSAGIKGTTNKGMFYSLRLGLSDHTSYIQGIGANAIKNTELSEFAPNSKYNSNHLKATIGWSKKWGVSKVTYTYFHQQSGVVELTNFSVDETDPFQRERKLTSPFIEQTSQVLSSETNYQFKKSSLHLNLGYQNVDRKETDPTTKLINRISYATTMKSLVYKLSFNSDPLKKFGYTIGVQGYSSNEKNYGEEGFIPNSTKNNLAGIIGLQYNLKKWVFSLGGRSDFEQIKLDKYSSSITIDSLSNRIDPTLNLSTSLRSSSAGIVFKANEKIKVKLNYSIGNSAPSVRQIGAWGKNESDYSFEKGNKNLKNQLSQVIESGIRFDEQDYSIELNAYSNNLIDYVYLKNTQVDTIIKSDTLTVDTVKLYNFTQSNARITGVELSITLHPAALDWLTIHLAYSKINSKLNGGGFLPGFPSDKLSGRITFSGKKLNYVYQPYLSLGGINYFSQSKVGEGEAALESYFLMDMQLGGSFRWGKQNFEIEISANNLFDTGYYSHNSSLNRLGKYGIRGMGRNVSLQFHIPFGLNSNK